MLYYNTLTLKRKEPSSLYGALFAGFNYKAPRQWHIFHTPLPGQYRLRWGISLPCSGWERVYQPRSNHRKAFLTISYRCAQCNSKRR